MVSRTVPPKRMFAVLLLCSMLWAACLPTARPADETPLPSVPPPSPSPSQPAPTSAPTATASSAISPTVSPTPTAPPASLTPLGLERLWAWTTRDILCDLAAQDFDGDGWPEVAVASYDRSVTLVDASGQDRWSLDTGGSAFSLDAADLDGDGRYEVLVGSANGLLRALSAAGDPLWQVDLGGRVTAISTVDLEGDGRLEVLAGARPRSLWLLNTDGTPLWQQSTPGAPTVFQVLGTPQQRTIVLGTEDGAVQAFAASGGPLWQQEGGGYVRQLVALEGGLIAGTRTGTLQSFTPQGRPGLAASLEGAIPALAAVDLEGDGRPEVLVGLGGEENGLLAMDLSGQVRWQVPTERGVWSLAFPDLEGDGQPEIVIGTDEGEIVVLDAWGRARGRTWVPFRVHGLLVVDLNQDGRDELLARASNHLYAFRGSPTGEEGERAPLVDTLERWPEDAPLLPVRPGQVELIAVGDIMPGRAVEPRMLVYGAGFPFAPLASLLRQADITTGNLEGVLAYGGTPLQKSFTFRARPELVSGWVESGFDLLTLANNHALDFGAEGLAETLQVLEQAGIAAVGAGPEAYAPVFLQVEGLRIAFLGRTAAIGRQDEVAWAEADELRQAVAQAREQADLVVVHLHAGIEYTTSPDDLQHRLARAAAEGGAALVIGHHPHAPQPVEWIGETLVAYSLGDFVFDIDDHDIARDGLVLRVLLSQRGVEGAELIPVRIVDDVQPRPRPDGMGRAQVEVLYAAELTPTPTPAATLPATATLAPTLTVVPTPAFSPTPLPTPTLELTPTPVVTSTSGTDG